jgi:hypothetical protein
MKKILLFIIFVASILASKGQNTSPYWSLAGNNNASANSKLGTTNLIPLRFFTKNLERMRIDTGGRVGIGISTPIYMLTVKASGGTPAASWKTGLYSPVFIGFADDMSSEFVLAGASQVPAERAVFQGRRSRGTLALPQAVVENDYLTSLLASGYDGSSFQNPALVSIFADGKPSSGHVPARVSLVTGTNAHDRQERLKVGSTGNFDFNNGQIVLKQSNGFTGIGTPDPAARLNVFSTENVTLTSPGFLMLGSSTGYNMGIDYNVIQARYNGTASSLYLNYYGGYTYLGASAALGVSSTGVTTTSGVLGVRGSSNASYALTVNASSSYNGINITDGGSAYLVNATKSGALAGIYVAKTSSSSFDACVWGHSTGSAYGVEGNSGTGIGIYGTTGNSASYAGYFAGNVYTTGSYLPSDITLKKDIKDFTKAIDIIDKLHPKIYQYRDDRNFKMMNLPKGERYGLIAEDLEKVLPNLVKQTKFQTATDEDRIKGNATPAIDFKAVNYTELIPILIKGMQEQQTQIQELQNQVDALTSMIKNNNEPVAISNGDYLKQNVPNPGVNNTVIGYYVTENSGRAQIKIADEKGSAVKVYNVSNGSGQLSIKSGDLAAGTYTYTLFVNGKRKDTKKMVIMK